MEEQSATTVNKYICKLVECIIFYSNNTPINVSELCKQIESQFELEFDILEVENAIKAKGRNRIVENNGMYTLTPKALDQLSNQSDPNSLLSKYINEFIEKGNKSYNPDILLSEIQKYLYHCFNSSTENLLALLHSNKIKMTDNYSISNEMVQQINEFISWDNSEKNKLLYDIISFSYEYCMLTTKKNSLLSKKIFKGKRFYLDSNIIFRMAGINKDERQFVTESFIRKCTEVGIELYYTSETLSELYRVINNQVKYIKHLTHGHAPVSYELLETIDNANEINDFYILFCKWCAEKGNKYNDYISFHNYLKELIRNTIGNLKYIDIPNKHLSINREDFEIQCKSLDTYKKEKRPTRANSQESLQADINNILYILSLRKKTQIHDLWQTKDYIVSADQLLASWAKKSYSGLPIVVIPSTWLSIILRFSGRTNNDYRSYCLFMGLRQHRVEDEDIIINPVKLLNAVSERTTERSIKETIINEIISNKDQYFFESPKDYTIAVEKAFESILKEKADEVTNQYKSIISEQATKFEQEKNDLEKQLEESSTEEAFIIKYANQKATKNIMTWKRLEWLQVILPIISLILVLSIVLIVLSQKEPFYSLFCDIIPNGVVDGLTSWNFITWGSAFLVVTIPNVLIIAPLKYLSSKDRQERLVEKYINQSKKIMK